MKWFKVFINRGKLGIVRTTDKAVLFKLPTEQTFWFPKKLLNFNDPNIIIMTISEDMEIKDVGSFMDLTAVVDATWKLSPNFHSNRGLGGDNSDEISDEDTNGVLQEDWIGPDDFGCQD